MPRNMTVRFVEYGNCPEILCYELGSVEVVGPNVRFVLVTASGRRGRSAVCGRVVMPVQSVLPGIELVIRQIGNEIGARILRRFS